MALNAIGGYSDLLSLYNSYQISPIQQQLENSPAVSDQDKNTQAIPQVIREQDEVPQTAERRPNASLENISISFGQRDSSLSGFTSAGSGITEMHKAINVMHQDDILQQYQYFVGDKNQNAASNVIVDDGDGVVKKIG